MAAIKSAAPPDRSTDATQASCDLLLLDFSFFRGTLWPFLTGIKIMGIDTTIQWVFIYIYIHIHTIYTYICIYILYICNYWELIYIYIYRINGKESVGCDGWVFLKYFQGTQQFFSVLEWLCLGELLSQHDKELNRVSLWAGWNWKQHDWMND